MVTAAFIKYYEISAKRIEIHVTFLAKMLLRNPMTRICKKNFLANTFGNKQKTLIYDSYPTAITSLEFLSVTKLFTIALRPDSMTWKKSGTSFYNWFLRAYPECEAMVVPELTKPRYEIKDLQTSGGTSSWHAWAKYVSSLVTSDGPRNKRKTLLTNHFT